MLRGLLLTAWLSLLACSKPPSPAAQALSGFLEQAARGNTTAMAGEVARGARLELKLNTELTEWVVAVVPPPNIGVYDWSKTKVVKDEVLPTGEHQLEMFLDVCIRHEDGGRCSRPNTYTVSAVMIKDEETWRVLSSNCLEKDIVR